MAMDEIFDAKTGEETVICKTKSKKYWADVPPTLDGMLGGFGFVSRADIVESRQLLRHLFNSKNPPGKSHALDCGAGIGRISKYLLTEVFEKVDLLEQNEEFLEKAKVYLGPRLKNVDKFWSVDMQSFVPECGKYDVVWIQWVLGYLTDDEVVKFFENCKYGLKPNGVIVVKENITSSGILEGDLVDSSVTRSFGQFRELFEKAGLDCYKQLKQHNFPKGLYGVIMFALRSKEQDVNLNKGNCDIQFDV